MFALRGIAVSLSIFAVLYGALSLAVCCVWRRVWLGSRRFSARRSADLLFTLRMIPFIAATAATLALAVPSFLLLEPRAVNEPLTAVPVVLGLCGIAVLVAGMWKAAAALAQVSQTVALWSREARATGAGEFHPSAFGSGPTFPVQRISGVVPPLTAAGILRPSVWLSRAAEFVLSGRELQCALQHEAVHVRRRDNLRKLILRLVAFPGMAELETAWREATEMAADDAAVSSASEALDLAAAVIKLSRLIPREAPVDLMTALVHSPAQSLNARVERLLTWTERRQSPAKGYSWGYALCASVAVLTALAVTYSELLVRVHAATEWLVR
jgi:beta-lactamase regulating signal transducer with metallopeptidase domain